ncbi:MAG: hypothetical protein AVDCRST_MAG93-4050, partial [uncultured Chloroflexia bacterium]
AESLVETKALQLCAPVGQPYPTSGAVLIRTPSSSQLAVAGKPANLTLANNTVKRNERHVV